MLGLHFQKKLTFYATDCDSMFLKSTQYNACLALAKINTWSGTLAIRLTSVEALNQKLDLLSH